VEEALKRRLSKFSLELEPSKTKLVSFGKFSLRDSKNLGKRPSTLSFLGLTLYNYHHPEGNYSVGMKTDKKRLHRIIQKLKLTMKEVKHYRLRDQWIKIN